MVGYYGPAEHKRLTSAGNNMRDVSYHAMTSDRGRAGNDEVELQRRS